MFRKIILFYLIVLLASCGKDVIIIEDPEPPIITDETFEVNLVGFTTDENRVYVSNSKVSIDEKTITSDDSGFFHAEKVLIGERGKVIQVKKDGYLPTVSRVANHKSLEQVMLNFRMVSTPDKITIDALGGSIMDDNGVLIVPNNALNTSTDIIFESFVGLDANHGNEDQLYFGDKVEFLLKEASIYIEGSSPLNINSDIKVQLSSDKFSTDDIGRLNVFKYDFLALTWKQTDAQLSFSGNEIVFPIDDYGWWTIAEKVTAQYGTLTLEQEDGSKINKAEIAIFYENETFGGSTLYSSTIGNISTYFPSEKAITASLNNGEFKSEFTSGFNSSTITGKIDFNEDIQIPFEGKVYACDFSLSDGYVAIISAGQHKVKKIENGFFSSEGFLSNVAIVLQFYSSNYDLISSKETDVEALKGDINNFFSCADLNDNLLVSTETSLLQDFDKCRVKVRPNETVVIGERSNADVFLVSFEGSKEGQYQGLIYFPEITDTDVSVEVVVNIVLYDEVENKLGGFIKTEYKSTGEELNISFIGNIE